MNDNGHTYAIALFSTTGELLNRNSLTTPAFGRARAVKYAAERVIEQLPRDEPLFGVVSLDGHLSLHPFSVEQPQPSPIIVGLN